MSQQKTNKVENYDKQKKELLTKNFSVKTNQSSENYDSFKKDVEDYKKEQDELLNEILLLAKNANEKGKRMGVKLDEHNKDLDRITNRTDDELVKVKQITAKTVDVKNEKSGCIIS